MPLLLRSTLAVPLLLWLATAPACAQAIDERNADTVQAQSSPDADNLPDLGKAAAQIVNSTNTFRQEQGHTKLTTSDTLTATARDFAHFMARTNKYGHHADGKRPAERAEEHGYESCIVAENIAYQYKSEGFATRELAQGFFEGWKHSPTHRQNMLDPDVTQTGVAIARSEKTGYYYAVQLLGRPKSMSITFKIANHADTTVQYKIGDQTFPLPPRHTRIHERCRPADLVVQPSDQQQSLTARPADGDHYTITRQADELQLRKQ